MKKKFFSLIVIGLLITILLTLTGCGNNGSKDKNDNPKIITQISEEYAFISNNGLDYELWDLDGNLIFTLPEGYVPNSKVVNGYFFVKESNRTETLFYSIDGTQPFEGKDVTPYTAYKGDKVTNDSFIYMVRVEEEKNTIDGKEKVTKMYSITDNLKDVSDDYVYSDSTSTNKYQATMWTIQPNPALMLNPSDTTIYNCYIKYNNGFFTHIKNGKELYEPIEGQLIMNEGSTTDVLAKINDKYYIVSEDGTKKEVSYIPNECSVINFYDGYIVAKYNDSIEDIMAGESKGSVSYLYTPEGTKIDF